MKEWPCQKLQKLGVGMAVCREDMLYKDYTTNYTTNLIPTSFFISEIILRVLLQDYWEEQFLSQKKHAFCIPFFAQGYH